MSRAHRSCRRQASQRSGYKQRDRLNVGSVREHVGHASARQAIAFFMNQNRGVTRQRRRAATHVHQTFKASAGCRWQRLHNLRGAVTRRVDEQLVEPWQCVKPVIGDFEQIGDCKIHTISKSIPGGVFMRPAISDAEPSTP